MQYPIQILDKNGKLIGELMASTPAEILAYINKGFRVINMRDGLELTTQDMNHQIGVADGVINILD